mgnify:CR=1 FL=1
MLLAQVALENVNLLKAVFVKSRDSRLELVQTADKHRDDVLFWENWNLSLKRTLSGRKCFNTEYFITSRPIVYTFQTVFWSENVILS